MTVQERARLLHRRGVAATSGGHPARAAGHLREGLLLLGWAPGQAAVPADAALAARLLISLAHAEAEQGHTDLGLGLLTQAQDWAAPEERTIVQAQLGLMLLRTGRVVQALERLDAAVPSLAGYDDVELARILLNRAVAYLALGRIRLAREDSRRSAHLSLTQGHDVLHAKALHNDGYCDLLLGDIPTALSTFARVEEIYQRVNPGFLPVLALDQARALLAAGLAREAGETLDRILRRFRRQRLTQDYAEAELARAQAALDARDHDMARVWAQRARAQFRRRGSELWTLRARLMTLRVDLARTRAPYRLVARADGLAAGLAALGAGDEARVARLLGVRALLLAGRTDAAAEAARALGATHSRAPLATLLVHHLTHAELAVAQGRRGAALSRVRTGLSLIDTHRGRVGSLDLRTGLTALGDDLARTGLAAVLDNGHARLVFDWSERCRAQAFRHTQVRPAEDGRTAEAVVELRELSQWMRTHPAQARQAPYLRRRCLELEREIRERGWRLRGTRDATAPAATSEIVAELAAADLALMSLLHMRGRLWALVVRRSRFRLYELGEYAPAAEAGRRLAGDLRAAAGRYVPGRLRSVIGLSIRRQVETITSALGPALAAATGASGLVVVPTMALAALPWGLLPPMAGMPLVVAPSAQVWLSARRARRDDLGVPLLVAGPDLEHAEAEVDQIAAVYPEVRRLSGAGATVEATLAALDGASVAHLAAHGHHERENVLFSRLDLADGPLMAYDLQRLAGAPGHVVLSACDVGQTVVRVGDEILGFAAALLYAGTSSVIGCVTPIPDEVAARVMTEYHRRLARRVPPACALAAAAEGEPVSSFVCFGAG
ncbi:CHAT domain-containing protein [Sphaerisporangium corydalis]|uniref:CHAT domain-containing protein n=1 Tax=Sphaerisporangium corydalis TaxID=1441875 RepID=A0ABV9EPR8_9ACTN|nr:CHAT domain-containing protein [Sphaerisporangium corydalis]